jgi:hypothetical protein
METYPENPLPLTHMQGVPCSGTGASINPIPQSVQSFLPHEQSRPEFELGRDRFSVTVIEKLTKDIWPIEK